LNPAHYSLTWANGVISALRRKYPRATEDVEKILGITDRNLAAFLAHNDPVFPHVRDMVHSLQAWRDRGANFGEDPVMLARWVEMWRRRANPRVKARLDSIDFCNIMKKQGSREGG